MAHLLHEIFSTTAARFPERVAVEWPGGEGHRVRLTYAEVEARSNALAHRLAPFVDGERVVAIMLPRTPDLYVAQLAVLKAGGAYTCLDPAFPEERLRLVFDDAQATCAISASADAERLGLPADRVLEVPGAGEGDPTPVPTPPGMDGERLAYVIYTSGTTGRPKGVQIEHRGIVNLVNSDVDRYRLGPDDRVVQLSTPAYDSSVEETWMAFSVGATLLVMDEATARLGPDLIPWLREEQATVFTPPPTLLRASGCTDPEAALPDLQLLYVGGEALPPDLADLWARGRWMENGYGPTECTVTVMRCRVEPGRPVTIGQPVPGCKNSLLVLLSGES